MDILQYVEILQQNCSLQLFTIFEKMQKVKLSRFNCLAIAAKAKRIELPRNTAGEFSFVTFVKYLCKKTIQIKISTPIFQQWSWLESNSARNRQVIFY